MALIESPPLAGRTRLQHLAGLTQPGLTTAGTGRRFVGLAPVAILVGATVARIAVIIATPHYVPVNDASDYDHVAVSLASAGHYPASGVGGPSAFRPPGFPFLLAFVYDLVGTSSASARWEAGRIAQALLGVVAVALIFLVARRVWGRNAGLVGAALAAVYPPLVLVGSSLMSEPLFIVLTLAAVFAALKQRAAPERLRYAALAGALTGLAADTRGNGIFLVLPLCFLVWSVRPRRSWASVRAPLALIAVCVLVLAPWAIRNTIIFGEFVPLGTEDGYSLIGTYNDAARDNPNNPALWTPLLAPVLRLHHAHPSWSEARISDQLVTESIDFVRAHPAYPLDVVFWSLVRLLNLPGPGLEHQLAPVWGYPGWLAVVSVYAFWVVGIVAILAVVTKAGRGAPVAFWGCPVALAAPTLLSVGLTRYRVPADPYLLILAGLGLLGVVDRIRRRAGKPALGPSRHIQGAPA